MTRPSQPREPRGVKTGGRWRTTYRSEGNVALAAEPATTDRANFADMDRGERLKAMHSEVERATADLSDPVKWREFLDAVSRFHRYSVSNTMLILHQRPDATRVAGFRDWQENFERTVKKGEKAIWVLAPCRYRKVTEANDGSETEEERLFFRPVPVFDLSQTEGPPLPEAPTIAPTDTRTEAPAGMHEALSAWVGAKGFTLADKALPEDHYGQTNFAAKTVTLNATHDSAQRALTLAHEVAHIALGHDSCDKARQEREIEAESLAYIVGRHFGLADAGSFSYVAHWARGDSEKVRKTADSVVKAAGRVLDEIDQHQEAGR